MLRGRVWPISGLKEKLLAALRGGIKTVLIPEENAKDLVENYIASMWSVRIERINPDHAALHAALSEMLLKPLLDGTDYGRLTGQLDDSLVDVSWCEKLPTPVFADIAAEFVAIVDQHVGSVDDLRYP